MNPGLDYNADKKYFSLIDPPSCAENAQCKLKF